ncbi:MAG: phosphoribosylanthranilate isomerase [Bacteroidota bacterium]|nr:phosphoribosylanthranilate isomerase [Bacteroidota bacterium]
MIIKACGLCEDEDLISVSAMGVDYAGFIFATDSPRDASSKLDPTLTGLLSQSVPGLKKTGVFVNSDLDEILEKITRFHLNAVQLHGNESPEVCELLLEKVEVIKSFSVNEEFDFEKVSFYEGKCTYFLFDTAGPLAGGNGFSFDWRLLGNYSGNTPFLLSGGIGPASAISLLEFSHPQFAGIDINSKFELYPGKKNILSLSSFVKAFKPIKNGL